MYTERVALQQELEFLREQDRINFERRKEIMLRLKELDGKDREAVDPNAIIDKLSEHNALLTRLIPALTWDQLITESRKEQVKDFKKVVTEEEETTTTTTRKKRTEETSEESSTTSTERIYVNRDLKKDSETVTSVLRELGRPVQLRELTAILEEQHDVKWGSPTTTMNHIMGHNPRINRVSKGFYQLT